MSYEDGSVIPSWTTNESYSKPPTPPPPPESHHVGQFVSHAPAENPATPSETADHIQRWNENEPLAKLDALEAKRRAAVREREREQAARTRHRALLAQKRDAEIKRREAEGEVRVEAEQIRAERAMAEANTREQRREASIRAIEDNSRKMEAETRRLWQVEKKRQNALQSLEVNRLREEETQRIKRDSILKKRAEMERVRDQQERLYQQRKQEEMNRKLELVEEMQKKRSERLADLERRRTNPLLLQQEKEFNQLIEIHAALGRLQVKMEQTQARREDVRERLLESRHLTDNLEIEENALSLSLQEVESDIKKLEGYQSGLEKLVSTRYDPEEYDSPVTKIQALCRGRRGRVEASAKAAANEKSKQNQAALAIQKTHRGIKVRKQMRDDKKAEQMVNVAVKIQALVRGSQTRTKAMAWKSALAKALIEKEKAMLHDKSTLIQCAFRSFLARRQFRGVLVSKIKQDRIKPFAPRHGGRAGRRAGQVPQPRVEKRPVIARKDPVRATYPTKPAPQIQRGEMSRIYVRDEPAGRRGGEPQPAVKTRFSAMGALVAQKPHPPHSHSPYRGGAGGTHLSPYSRSPRRPYVPSYPTAVMAEIPPQKLFNYVEVLDAGWGRAPEKMAYWHDAAPPAPPRREHVPTGVPFGGRGLPEQSMLLRI